MNFLRFHQMGRFQIEGQSFLCTNQFENVQNRTDLNIQICTV